MDKQIFEVLLMTQLMILTTVVMFCVLNIIKCLIESLIDKICEMVYNIKSHKQWKKYEEWKNELRMEERHVEERK